MNNSERPSGQEFFTNWPLYQSFDLSGQHDKVKHSDTLTDLFLLTNSIDAYCIDCKKVSTFNNHTRIRTSSPGVRSPNVVRQTSYFQNGEQRHIDYYVITFRCARSQSHTELNFLVRRASDSIITKIGQYPSLADLSTNDVEKYSPVLSEENLGEFKRAIGLASHGIGVGSFVYLRRILEDLVEEAHTIAQSDTDWNEESYREGRIQNRIKLLSDYLPNFLVENRKVFSILGKGLHELSEKDCLTYFDPLRVGIELILDEKLEQEEKEKKTKSAEKKIASIHKKLKSTDPQ